MSRAVSSLSLPALRIGYCHVNAGAQAESSEKEELSKVSSSGPSGSQESPGGSNIGWDL